MPLPFAEDLLHLVERYQYLALFLLLLVEESGVPLPLPGDGLMTFAGYLVSTGHLAFLPAFASMEAATLLGASLLHRVGLRGGRPLLIRYGRYLHLDGARVMEAERWLVERGLPTIVLARLVPGLRIATSFAAGVFEVPYTRFLPAVALGSSLYVLAFMILGLGLGAESRNIARLLPHPMLLAGLVLLLAIGVGLVIWLRIRVHR